MLKLSSTCYCCQVILLDQQTLLSAVTEALDQYKQNNYVQKLKTDITPDFMDSGHQDLITLLYRQVTHIDGRHFV